MACRGVLFALTDEQAERFTSAASDEELSELVEEVEEAWDENYLEETDKAWDSIHRCLSDGTLSYEGGEAPLNMVILGGEPLYEGDEYIIVFVSADKVGDVAVALAGVTEAWFRERFSHLPETDYPPQHLKGDGYEELFEYSWTYLGDIREFYQRAAEANRAVIFTVDQ